MTETRAPVVEPAHTGLGRAEYPLREKFFAGRFIRLLARVGAALEIGPDGCWMLAIIAQLEDSKRYSGAILFYNEPLMSVAGYTRKHTFIAARTRAVEAGWLHYEHGGKRKPGRYWVTVPPRLEEIPDGSCDENVTEGSVSSDENVTESVTESQDAVTNSSPKADSKRHPFLPIPITNTKRERAHFQKPSAEEVQAYSASIGYKIDAQGFVDFYTSNGWRVGRNPMRDWQAAVRTWKKRDQGSGKGQTVDDLYADLTPKGPRA